MEAIPQVPEDTSQDVSLDEVVDILLGARAFVRVQVLDASLRHLLIQAIDGLEGQLEADKAMLPFIHLPLAVYAANRGDSAPARPLAIATTLLFLGIDILDDIADGDLPHHWQGHPLSEVQLAAATLLSSLPQLAIGQLNVLSTTKSRMLACLSEGLLHMSGGQLQDLRGAGKEHLRPEDVEKAVEQKSGAEGALMAMLAAHMVGLSEETAKKYGEFGRELATAGQIATDCYDLFQATQSKDFANGSRTLPIVIQLSRLQGADREVFLAQLDEAKTSDSARALIRRDLRANGVVRLCAFVVEMHCQKARDVLMALDLSDESRARLQKMVDFVSFFADREVKG